MLTNFFEAVQKELSMKLDKMKISNQEIKIGEHLLSIKQKIDEGGYSDIYLVKDITEQNRLQKNSYFKMSHVKNKQKYILKRMVLGYAQDQDEDDSGWSIKTAFQSEVEHLRLVLGSENIVRLIDSQVITKGSAGVQEGYILLEYCPNHTLFGLIEDKCMQGYQGISNEQLLLQIIQQVANGLTQLHSRGITHRDLQIENIILGKDYKWKIIDLGSSTKVAYNSEISMVSKQAILEEIEMVTTPIYRAPEQIDVYQSYKINEKVDIWALGCIMYTLMYHKPPFEEGSRLARPNVSFRFPQVPVYSKESMNLVKAMLQLKPDARPTANQVREAAQSLSDKLAAKLTTSFLDPSLVGSQPNSFIMHPQPQSNNGQLLQPPQGSVSQRSKGTEFNYSLYVPSQQAPQGVPQGGPLPGNGAPNVHQYQSNGSHQSFHMMPDQQNLLGGSQYGSSSNGSFQYSMHQPSVVVNNVIGSQNIGYNQVFMQPQQQQQQQQPQQQQQQQQPPVHKPQQQQPNQNASSFQFPKQASPLVLPPQPQKSAPQQPPSQSQFQTNMSVSLFEPSAEAKKLSNVLEQKIEQIIRNMVAEQENNNQNGIKETVIRKIILYVRESIAQGKDTQATMKKAVVGGIVCQGTICKKNYITAIKTLILAIKLQQYAPDCFDGMQRQQKDHYFTMFESWKQILNNNQHIQANEQQAFYTKLIGHLFNYLYFKAELMEEFSYLVDGGLNLRGIIDNSDFSNRQGQKAQNQRSSPLQVKFLKKLRDQLTKLVILNTKMFDHISNLKAVRLQLALVLMEEQFLHLSLLSHLHLAFIISYEFFSASLNHQMRTQILTFIEEQKTILYNSAYSFSAYVAKLKEMSELNSIVYKFPVVPGNLVSVIDEMKQHFVSDYRVKRSQEEFKMNEVLNINGSITGIKIPIPFQHYGNFDQQCQPLFDTLLSFSAFRDKLGQNYQTLLLKKGFSSQNRRSSELAAKYKSVNMKELSVALKQASDLSASKPGNNLIDLSNQKSEGLHQKKITLVHAPHQLENQNTVFSNTLSKSDIEFLKGNQNQKFKEEDILKAPDFDELFNKGIKYAPAKKEEDRNASLLDDSGLLEAFKPKPEDKANETLKKSELNTAGVHRQDSCFSLWKQAELESPSKNQGTKASEISHACGNSVIEEESNDDDFLRDSSVEDSGSQDYFLMVNQKTKDLAIKRRKLRIINEENQMSEIDEIYAAQEKERLNIEKKILEKYQQEQIQREKDIIAKMEQEMKEKTDIQQQEMEAMIEQKKKELAALKKNQEKFNLERENIDRIKKEFETKKKELQQKQEEMEAQQKLIEENKKKMQDQQSKLAQENLQLKQKQDRVKEVWEENRKKLQEEKQKIEEVKQKLYEVNQKQKTNKYKMQEEIEKAQADSKIQVQYIEELEQQKTDNMEKFEALRKENEALKLQFKQMEEQKLKDTVPQLRQNDSPRPGEPSAQRWQPDITNKKKNLAVQFLEHTLKGREFMNLNINELTGLTQIGEGAAAIVYKAKYKYTDVAVKKLKAQNLIMNNKLSIEFQREIEALSSITHPNLILFMGATADQGFPVIVTEFCPGGTLFELLHEKKKSVPVLTYKQRHKMMKDIAQGMNFMHQMKNPLMHRDLKSLNILLQEPVNGPSDFVNCKVTDFGLTRSIEDSEVLATGMAGTFHWMAPEVLENNPYSYKADVYSFGIVMWEILAREPPFAEHKPHQIIYGVINHKERPPLNKIPKDCPHQLIVIMKACWEQDPNARPTFADVLEGLNMLTFTN